MFENFSFVFDHQYIFSAFLKRLFIHFLSKATPGPQPGGEQTKISKIEFDPLSPSTMHVNTLRPGILVLSLFVWS